MARLICPSSFFDSRSGLSHPSSYAIDLLKNPGHFFCRMSDILDFSIFSLLGGSFDFFIYFKNILHIICKLEGLLEGWIRFRLHFFGWNTSASGAVCFILHQSGSARPRVPFLVMLKLIKGSCGNSLILPF